MNYTVSETVDPENSMRRHQAMDLVVNERVYEFVQPQMAAACGGEEGKRLASPLFQDMRGLCPIFVSYSAHEVCTDDNAQLVEALEQAGVDVDRAVHPYLCHAWQTLAAFLPEAVQAEAEICDWLRRRSPAWIAAAAAAAA